MFHKFAMVTLVAFVVSAMVGCGSSKASFATVTGTVKVGGNPVGKGVIVKFVLEVDTEAVTATGATDGSGKYTLETQLKHGESEEGGPIGPCVVTVKGEGVPAKYGSGKSGLKKTIEKGDQTIDIELDAE